MAVPVSVLLLFCILVLLRLLELALVIIIPLFFLLVLHVLPILGTELFPALFFLLLLMLAPVLFFFLLLLRVSLLFAAIQVFCLIVLLYLLVGLLNDILQELLRILLCHLLLLGVRDVCGLIRGLSGLVLLALVVVRALVASFILACVFQDVLDSMLIDLPHIFFGGGFFLRVRCPRYVLRVVGDIVLVLSVGRVEAGCVVFLFPERLLVRLVHNISSLLC